MQGPTFQLLSKMMKVKIFSSLFLLPSKKNESSCINYVRYEGAGEEKDHCAWLFPWPLIHSCCVLFLQGLFDCSVTLVKFKRGFLVFFVTKYTFIPPTGSIWVHLSLGEGPDFHLQAANICQIRRCSVDQLCQVRE